MKKRAIFFLFLCGTGTSFAQSTAQTKQVSTSQNGVVVHESAGVEGFYTPPGPQVTVRTIDDWSLAECIDALKAVDDKLSTLGYSEEDQASRTTYLAEKQKIEARKEQLLTNH